MRMWVLCSLLCATSLAGLGCKKKSACVRRVERYLPCDEAKADPERACANMAPETKLELERCDKEAAGDCDKFLVCTGVKSQPRDPAAADASAAAMAADPRNSASPSPSPAADGGAAD